MSTNEPTGSHFSLLTLVCAVLVVAGGGIWLFFANGVDGGRAWRSLLTNFLFFTSLGGGLVVWPAVVRTCNGSWHARVERLAAAGVAFSVPSILTLIVLWIGSPNWSPWYGVIHHQGVWLNNSFIFGRDLAALFLFWGVAGFYLIRRHKGEARIAGSILILVYCLVFTLLGFDLVMALDPKWYSSLAGGYFFISGLYIAITGWAFLAVWQTDASEEQLHDLGKLIVGFSLMTAYLMYSQLLPIWYTNLPHEIRFLVPRVNFNPWKTVSYALIAVVYLGPLVLLLTEKSKRNRWSLGAISLLILAGMWVERWWLIEPTLQQVIRFGLLEFSTAMAFAGMFAIGVDQFNRRMPKTFLRGEQ